MTRIAGGPMRWFRPERPAVGRCQLKRAKLDAFFPEGGWPGLLEEGPFRAPRFGAAWAPVALLAAPLSSTIDSGLAGDGPDAVAREAARAVMAQLRAARVGGTPGLADP